MLNLNASLTKAGVPYSTLWSRDFTDEFFLGGLRRWLAGQPVEHDSSHVHPLSGLKLPARAEQTGAELAGSLLLVVSIVAATRPEAIALVFAAALAAGVASRVSLAVLATAVWLPAFFFTSAIALPALFTTPGPAVGLVPVLGWRVTAPGLRTATLLLLRVEACATLAHLLVFTTPWPHILKALRVFRVPVVFVAVLGMTYRYILLLLETARDMFEAHRARTVARPHGGVRMRQVAGSAGVLLGRTVALSGEVYLAMQARGFRGEVRVLDDFRLRPRDLVALVSIAALAATAPWVGR
jgi:cobalt ECF transporter T component CbiQ